jgi:hypothetical protein
MPNLKCSQAQAALESLAKAGAFLAPAVAAEAQSASSGPGPATLAAAAVAGFSGLVKRTQKDHAGALPLLKRGLVLAAAAPSADHLASAAAADALAAAVASDRLAAETFAATAKAPAGRRGLWGRKPAAESKSSSARSSGSGGSGDSSSSSGSGGSGGSSSDNSSSRALLPPSGLAGDAAGRWWDRADVREMFINYGDACLRAVPASGHLLPGDAAAAEAAAEAAAAYAWGAVAGLFAHPLQRPVHEVSARACACVCGALHNPPLSLLAFGNATAT